MTSRPKDKGTRFETAVAGYARMRTEDAEIRRFSLSGVNDHGDVGYVRRDVGDMTLRGIIECKNYSPRNKAGTPQEAQLKRWQQETAREMASADADFALLAIHRKGCSDRDPTSPKFGDNWCWATVRSLYAASGRTDEPDNPTAWVCMTLGGVFDLIDGSKVFEL